MVTQWFIMGQNKRIEMKFINNELEIELVAVCGEGWGLFEMNQIKNSNYYMVVFGWLKTRSI